MKLVPLFVGKNPSSNWGNPPPAIIVNTDPFFSLERLVINYMRSIIMTVAASHVLCVFGGNRLIITR